MTKLRQASRSLIRRRGFALAVAITLAAGIGITTALFAVVDTVLLKPLPYPDGDQLAYVMESSPTHRDAVSLVAPGRLEDWNRLSHAFDAISGTYTENVTDTSGAEPERLQGRRVAPRYFAVFGTAPLRGRTFTPDEERFGGPTVAIISESYWTRRFGRAEDAVGRRLIVAGSGDTIVGVMPQSFAPAAVDVWIPAQLAPGLIAVREARFLTGVGRIRHGVTLDEARRDLASVQRRLGEQFPKTDKDWSVDVRSLKEVRVGDYRRALWVVFGAESLLFAIALANVAGLILVQLRRRATEFAIRTAIGASRGQVVLVVAREVLLLVVTGGMAGAALSVFLVGLARATFTSVPRMAEVTVDARAVACAVALSAVAAFAAGIIPAWLATRRESAPLLAGAGRDGGSGAHWTQRALVIAQIAASVLLVGSAALLVRSYGALRSVDMGFNPSGAITFHIGAAWGEDRLRVRMLQKQLLDGMQQLPGVRAAGFANFLPATGATLRYQVKVDGITGPEPDGSISVGERTIAGRYLEALQVPLVAGSWCATPQTDGHSPLTAMVNRRFADLYGTGSTLVGRHLTMSQGLGTWEIAGVAGNAIEDGPGVAPTPYIYVCMPLGSWPDPEYVIRADGDARAVMSGVRALVRSLDASRPIFGVRPVQEVVDAAFDQPRLNATILTAFALAAVSLAALGLYGVLMLIVAERRRELGIRLALGAAPRDVVRLVLSGAGRLIGAGLAAGILLLALASRLLSTLLFGVKPIDGPALAADLVTLALVSVIAVAIPARRAATVNAIDAIRD